MNHRSKAIILPARSKSLITRRGLLSGGAAALLAPRTARGFKLGKASSPPPLIVGNLNIINHDTAAWTAQTGFSAVRDKVVNDFNTFFNINCTINYQWDYGSTAGLGNPVSYTTNLSYTSPTTYSAMRSKLLAMPSDSLKAVAYSSANLPILEAGLGSPPYSGTVYSWPTGLDTIFNNGTLAYNGLAPLGVVISSSAGATWDTSTNGTPMTGTNLPTTNTLLHALTLGAPSSPGGYPLMYATFEAGALGTVPPYLYQGVWNGTTLTWSLYGPAGADQGANTQLPKSFGLNGIGNVRGDWVTPGLIYVTNNGMGCAYYNP